MSYLCRITCLDNNSLNSNSGSKVTVSHGDITSSNWYSCMLYLGDSKTSS